jgi:hypothetical protein
MSLSLKLIIKSIALINVVGLLQTKELWRSIIKSEQGLRVKKGYVLVEAL